MGYAGVAKWQTRRFQVPVVVNTMWVRLPSSAPNILNKKSFLRKAFFIVKNTICRGFELNIPLYAEIIIFKI